MRKPALNGSVAVAAAITVALYLPSAAAWAQDVVIKKVDRGNILLVDEDVSADGIEEVEVEQIEIKLQSQSWIGVKLEPLSDVVRVQLDLPDEAGVVVGHVFPESPADGAGIEQYDIIISSGDHVIRQGAEMVELVKKTKDGKLPLTILRKGKLVELTVTPAERPMSVITRGGTLRVDDDSLGSLSLRRFNIVRPGVVLQQRDHEEHRLPEGMRLRIEREGDKPAQITTDRDDDHWEVSEDELDELPDDVREHVERYLGRPHASRRFAFDTPVRRSWDDLVRRTWEGSDNDDEDRQQGDQVWQDLEEGGALPGEFHLDRALDQIESLRKQFEQLADEQAERTEGLIEEKGEELEETLNDRVTRLEEMLTQRADQLREMIQSFFGDRDEVEIEIEANDDNGENEDAAEEEVEQETEEDVDVELDDVELKIELDLDADNAGDAV